mmetsp:Transcript_11070/g.20124  ORF Transcript_11070/g.20124 Transcript_11070/m.20124 type:complete len:183 (+) Transcript_11070:61-609(+)
MGKSAVHIDDVKVKRSRIRGAGQGLYSMKAIQKGMRLPHHYDGKRLTLKEFEKLQDCTYVMGLFGRNMKHVAIDAKNEAHPLRYVNGARTEMQRKLINCKIVQSRGKVYYETTRSVKAGEELIVDYGKGYWDGVMHMHELGNLRGLQKALRQELRAASTAAERERLQAELEDAIDEEAILCG